MSNISDSNIYIIKAKKVNTITSTNTSTNTNRNANATARGQDARTRPFLTP